MGRNWILLAMTAGISLLNGRADAAGPDGFNASLVMVKPGADRAFTVEGSAVAPAWRPYGGVWLQQLERPVVFETLTGAQYMVVESLTQLHLAAGLGLGGLAELEVVIPVSLAGTGDLRQFPGLTDASLGDVVTRLRFSLIDRGPQGDGLGLNVGAAASLPSGSPAAANGEGSVTITPKIAISYGFLGMAAVDLNLGTVLRTEASDFGNLDFGHDLVIGVAGRLSPLPWLHVAAEVAARTTAVQAFSDSAETPVELLVGARANVFEGLSVELGAGRGLAGGYGEPQLRLFGGLQWAEARLADKDDDGTADDVDACPDDAEDDDGHQDDDGCPDTDDDGDGLADRADGCPRDAEDADGFEDADGCPDPDDDQDGLADAFDTCPREPEDHDGDADADGCPDADQDGDGVGDAADACVDAAETKNGFEDDDGCPDTVPLARREGCRILISDTIHFGADAAVIRAVSFPTLNEVARLIRSAREVTGVDIQGHTDAQGAPGTNLALSEKRAKAVRQYLLSQGIKPTLLHAEGFGHTRPIADNGTEEGRAANRRVEFHVRGGDCKGERGAP